ncbi:hypothetical protein [Methylobacterium sp. Leaf87]|uniref:hypothetical protein n=1 Tax=Methylobacterium sp. Leaf87 TaxID=1736243 RepID=UPI0032985BEC
MADEGAVAIAHDDATGLADVGPAILLKFTPVAADTVEVASLIVVAEATRNVAGATRRVEALARTAALERIASLAILAIIIDTAPAVASAQTVVAQPRLVATVTGIALVPGRIRIARATGGNPIRRRILPAFVRTPGTGRLVSTLGTRRTGRREGTSGNARPGIGRDLRRRLGSALWCDLRRR